MEAATRGRNFRLAPREEVKAVSTGGSEGRHQGEEFLFASRGARVGGQQWKDFVPGASGGTGGRQLRKEFLFASRGGREGHYQGEEFLRAASKGKEGRQQWVARVRPLLSQS